MSNRIFALAAAVFIAACTTAAPDTAADEAALRTAAPLWWDRYNAGDADGVAALYAEDAILMAPDVPAAVGRPAIREYLVGDIAASKSGGFTLAGGEVNGAGAAGDQGWVSGSSSATDASGATVYRGNYISLYQRVNGEWLIIRDIWNSDTPPAAAPVADTAAPATTR
ncbi:MAG: YybH family protein [Gemmatimonadaceae bacterium]